ncbi:hypothetical protein ACHAWX_006252 [Stephanocyclus meneghinianus]
MLGAVCAISTTAATLKEMAWITTIVFLHCPPPLLPPPPLPPVQVNCP